jgi:opacity protein-like surface antigen
MFMGNARSLSFTVFLLVVAAPVEIWAIDSVDIRPYLQPRLGIEKSFHYYTQPNAVPGASLESPAHEPQIGATLGADLGRYWGVELAGDYVKTNLVEALGKKAGDYAVTTLLGQLRFRYPLLQDRLVPYLLAGGGIGHGEFSGREDFSFNGGGSDTVPLGVIGGGAEYFVMENIALGIEAKYYFDFHPQIRLSEAEERQKLTLDGVGVTANMRIYLDQLATGKFAQLGDQRPARDSDAMRGYFSLRGGVAFLTDKNAVPGATFDDLSGPLADLSLGMNFNKHWGAEFAFDYARTQLRSPTLGKITGYPIWTFAALARFRYPLLNDKLSPYILAGPGVGFGEIGDLDQPSSVTGIAGNSGNQDNSLVAVFGAGMDYFIGHNVAFNVEIKRITFFDTSIKLYGQPKTLSPEFVSLVAGIRVFFP